jgi:hypothetical protein
VPKLATEEPLVSKGLTDGSYDRPVKATMRIAVKWLNLTAVLGAALDFAASSRTFLKAPTAVLTLPCHCLIRGLVQAFGILGSITADLQGIELLSVNGERSSSGSPKYDSVRSGVAGSWCFHTMVARRSRRLNPFQHVPPWWPKQPAFGCLPTYASVAAEVAGIRILSNMPFQQAPT